MSKIMKKYKLCYTPILKKQTGGNDTFKLTTPTVDEIYKTVTSKDPKYSAYGSNSSYDQKTVNTTYGEMLVECVDKIIEKCSIGSNDIVCDFGSGQGKITLQMFVNGQVKKAFGIEIVTDRWLMANSALGEIFKSHPEFLGCGRTCHFINANIKDCDYVKDITVAYMCSTLYPNSLMEIIENNLKACPNIRAIITHKEWKGFENICGKHETLALDCTWSKQLTWHIYLK